MISVRVAAFLAGCAALLGGATLASAFQDPPSTPDGSPRATPRRVELATFGGGCFWCMESVFERVKGVKSVVSGYMGGSVPNPTYEMVHTGQTGHAEVVQLEFDNAIVSYDTLLHLFWESHDPTTLNRQGPDVGTQYRSVIFYHDEEQKKAAEKVYQELVASRRYRSPIVTQLAAAGPFYPAEDYHQDFFRRNRNNYYSRSVIVPKLRKLAPKIEALNTPKPATPAPPSKPDSAS